MPDARRSRAIANPIPDRLLIPVTIASCPAIDLFIHQAWEAQHSEMDALVKKVFFRVKL
jgi:hypothetical protein